ncbi:GNAT family N-acetyltransferase [Wenzhouxiangella sp. AB-CW3]|uniref:GNAT family N-acetyltransferase n=1 Tax=Wenzhouxiangella sp. AB-CW3 TaxID=2771012 RepID=UPI00168A5827|nr:GNAT family N-acetyltransferase [Wenzhouxiangella sp. AB-CW3]QOC23860.1 GNAT family N-acetyltransferase [Wenzhouxiangella sp. AB-CW3]
MTARGTRKYPFTRLPLGRPWCEAIELPDGRRFILRPMQPSDAPMLRRSFLRLTPDEVRMRFMHPIKELTPQYASRLASIDHEHEFALVLVEARSPEEALIGAVVRVAMDADGRQAEFAIIVGGELKRQRLGRYLLTRAIEWARKKGIKVLYGLVLEDNEPMLSLARSLGFSRHRSHDNSGVVEVRKLLQ